MYCTKCGKEIPKGENKICDECQKNLLNEIEENEKENDKAQEKKETGKKFKIAKEKFENKNFELAVVFLIIVAFIVVVTALLINIVNTGNVGNSIGNIRNYGYAAEEGNYIYYLAPNADSTQIGIFKIKKDKKDAEPKELIMKEWDILSLNVVGNEIYFIGISPETYSEEDTVDNKIYRMKTDGSNLEVINDNEFNNDCYEIYAVDNKIYYIGIDSNIYKMDKDGSNKEIVTENGTGYLGITEKYIIYNVGVEDSTEYITHIMDLDGKNSRPIIENTRLYSVNIDGNYIYYTDENKNICRVKIDDSNPEIICETTAYNMNADGDYVYYLNYADAANSDYTVCIYRVKKDGTTETPEKIKAMETYSSFIDIVGNWIIYMDSNETEGFINLVKFDGSDEIRLYTLNYEEYYSNIAEQNPTSEPENDSSEVSETNTTVENDTSNVVENTTEEVGANTVTNEVANTTVAQ